MPNRIRENAQMIAKAHGVAIEHVNNSHLRKEDLVSKVLAQRGDHPGLVHILSAMEACSAYEPWHDKQTHKTYLRSTLGKCLHYYCYFMDAEVGLCYLRVSTWCPFRLQFYGNGHSWLARKLTAEGIDFATADNALANKRSNINSTSSTSTLSAYTVDRAMPANWHWAATDSPSLELIQP